MGDIITTTEVLAVSPLRDMVMASTTPATSDRPVHVTGKIVSSLFGVMAWSFT